MKENLKKIIKTIAYLAVASYCMRIDISGKTVLMVFLTIIIKSLGFYFTVLCSCELLWYLIQSKTGVKNLSNLFTKEPFRGNNQNHQYYLNTNEQCTTNAYMNHIMGNMHKK